MLRGHSLPSRPLSVFLVILLISPACDKNPDNNSAEASVVTPAKNGPSATAQPKPVPPVWLSATEVKRLNEQEGGQAEVEKTDAFVLWAAGKEGAERDRHVAMAAAAAKTMLHKLFYDVDFTVLKHPIDDPPFHAALSEFEVRAGLGADGLFSSGDLSKLSYWSSLSSYLDTNVSPLGFYRVSGEQQSGGYVSAEGTWVIKGEEVAYPINKAQIDCWRSFGNCIVADGHVYTPKPNDPSTGSLSVDTSYWDITSWSPTRIVAEQSAVCRNNVMTLDLAAKQVFQIQTDKPNTSTDPLCKTLDRLGTPRLTTLEDSFKVSQSHYEALRESLSKISKFPAARFEILFKEPTAGK